MFDFRKGKNVAGKAFLPFLENFSILLVGRD